MRETTPGDRARELRALLARRERNPESDWSAERRRAAILRQMLTHETKGASA